MQERRSPASRAWRVWTSPPARRPHPRGGLSPAALLRVQLFIDENLAERIHLRDLALRAGLSRYHFARANARRQRESSSHEGYRCEVTP
ncbi:MAG: hypothetical protein GEV06_06435 [Luteitalea sp.]|nr:hypothetical protein [Luteitalea sp.]